MEVESNARSPGVKRTGPDAVDIDEDEVEDCSATEANGSRDGVLSGKSPGSGKDGSEVAGLTGAGRGSKGTKAEMSEVLSCTSVGSDTPGPDAGGGSAEVCVTGLLNDEATPGLPNDVRWASFSGGRIASGLCRPLTALCGSTALDVTVLTGCAIPATEEENGSAGGCWLDGLSRIGPCGSDVIRLVFCALTCEGDCPMIPVLQGLGERKHTQTTVTHQWLQQCQAARGQSSVIDPGKHSG